MPEYSKNNYVLYTIAKPTVKLYLTENMNFSFNKKDAKEFYDKVEMDNIRNIFKIDLQEENGIARVYIPESLAGKNIVIPASEAK